MPVEVILPKVDMDMSHGTIAGWHVPEGGRVEKGAALFDIETDKAAMEVEAPASGILRRVSAKAGDRVAVGAPVAWIYGEGEDATVPPPAVTPPASDGAMSAVANVPAADADALPSCGTPGSGAVPPASGSPRATPAARAAARAAGLALDGVAGTGPRGRIQRADVERAADAHSSREPVPPPGLSAQIGPLAVTRKDGQGAPIVLLHGFAADNPSWLPLERALGSLPGSPRPLVRIELPGHGRSPRRVVPSFAALARMMTEAFDAALPEGGPPVHLVGHSLGGAVALAIADIRPRRVASLSLLAPAGLGPQVDGALIAGLVRASRPESLLPWLRQLADDPASIDDAFARAAMAARADPTLRAAQAAMAEALFPDGTQAFDLRPALARVRCPAQIVWTRHDRVIPSAQAVAADGEFAIHLLPGAAHAPQVEHADRVARLIRQLAAAAEAETSDGGGPRG